MLVRIIRHDWRNLTADRTMLVVAGILVLAIGYGVANGAAWVGFQQRTLEQAAQEEGTRLGQLRTDIADAEAGRSRGSDPRGADAIGRRSGLRYATLPPAPLAALAIGQSDLYPYYFKVSTAGKDTFLGNDEIENPVHLLSGRFDAAFVILYLYPLVILALSYNLVSGEKEAGTLALALSQPVSLAKLVLGKVVLRFSLVVSVVLATAILGAAIAGAPMDQSETWGRLGLWSFAVVVYGAFWFALAAIVNGFGAASTTNAMALAGAWLALVLVIPSLVNVVAKTAHPVPSRVGMVNALRTASVEASARGSALLARYMEDHPDLVSTDEAEIATASATSFAVQEEVERKMQPLMDRFKVLLDEQQEIVDRYRYLSPAIVTQSILHDAAGTGTGRYKHFLDLTDEFHQQWRDWFTPRVIHKEQVSSAHFASIPQFRFVEESLATVLLRSSAASLGLAIATVLAIFAARFAMKKYSIAG